MSNSNQVQIPGYVIEKVINTSKFAVIFMKNLADSKCYILKEFPLSYEYSQYAFMTEKKILSSLHHENIIGYARNPLIEVYIANQKIIPIEYAPYGDFFDLTMNYALLGEKMIRTYFHQLIEGIDYLHSKKIAHLDIKPDNLLLGEDYHLKIADFDLAQKIDEKRLVSRGTENYRAPEVWNGKCRNFIAADIYSAGICLYVLLTEAFPFIEETVENEAKLVQYDIFQNKNKLFWSENEQLFENEIKLTPNLRDLLNRMWIKDPSQRITIHEIKISKWYNEPIYSKDELKEKMSKILSHS